MKSKWIAIVSTAAIIGGVAAAPAFAATQSTSVQTTSSHAKKHVSHHKRFDLNKKELLSILGVDSKTLNKDLKSGQSIVDVANSKGISEQTLVEDLQNQLKTKLNQAVQNGKLSSDKESQILSNATKRFTKLIEHKGLQQFKHKGKLKSQASQQNQNL